MKLIYSLMSVLGKPTKNEIRKKERKRERERERRAAMRQADLEMARSQILQ